MTFPPALRPALVVLLAALVLTGAARRRGAEYDEAYSLFVTAGTPRPAWPDGVFQARLEHRIAAGHAGLVRIARELRATDVHPPLYFWALGAWRRAVGPGLFAARLLSVLAALVALVLVGAIARAAAIPSVPAMAFTLGCYGFTYTGAIARNFALAEALALAGVWLALGPGRIRAAAAGMALGAASFTNYLAAFLGAAVLIGTLCRGRWQRAGWVLGGMLPWLPGGLWFLLAQRNSRAGQFPPFHLGAALLRLLRDAAGASFGGLPLYVPAGWMRLSMGLGVAALATGVAGLILARWRRIGAAAARPVLGAGALAPAAGLLALGLASDSMPIELRYLAFATPFLALLLAGALARLPRPAGWAAGGVVALVQALAVWGLLARPETMQPARAAASAAAHLAGRGGLVLLPRGNDGVGVVGPFLAEAPGWLRVRLVGPGSDPRALAAGSDRVILALIGVDRASRATLPRLRAAFAGPGWRVVGTGFDTRALVRATPPDPGSSVRPTPSSVAYRAVPSCRTAAPGAACSDRPR